MCDYVSSWYFMDLWKISCYSLNSNRSVLQQAHDDSVARCKKILKENLINFRNTRTEKRSKKKSWIDWYFAIKLFIFFNHLVMGRAAKLLWGSRWVNRKETKESKNEGKNWYKIKWSIKEHTGTIHGLIEWWKLFLCSASRKWRRKNEITIN